jgi:RimJ/RimL family protein N-acetyltransferase
MIQVYNNPFLLDYIKVCAAMPQDEREQLEAFTGEPYSIDGAAVGNFSVPGPKWVIKLDDEPIAVGGFVPQRLGVWRDFMLTTPTAWQHWFAVTRICRRAMDAMFASGQAHRLECIVPAARIASRIELVKWYKILGYNKEALHYGYCANGADAVSFSRVKH